jgi:hypothetical protein
LEKIEESAARTIMEAFAYRSTCFLRYEQKSDSLLENKINKAEKR